MPFDLLLLLGGGIAIAQAFGPTGVSAAFGEVLRPWIGSVPPVLLLFAVVGSVSMLSEVASNTAIATLLLPIVREGAQAASLDPLFLMLPVVIGASCSFAADRDAAERDRLRVAADPLRADGQGRHRPQHPVREPARDRPVVVGDAAARRGP
jgi:hypothetical protein